MNRITSMLMLIAMSGTAYAQTAHFDMSPEAQLAPAAQAASEPAPETSAPVVALPDLTRHLLPAGTVRLTGENDSRNYQIYLTAAQAAAPAKLQLGYINALVVAPESSRIRAEINGVTIINTAPASSAAVAEIAAEIPKGTLRAGFNQVSIRADHRHRTDCSIGSTYELWSEINGSRTFLSFSGSRVGALSRLDDIAAVGWDGAGTTTIRLVMPDRTAVENGVVAADLVQAIALNLRAVNAQVEIADRLSTGPEAGVLNVLLAPAHALPPTTGALRDEAADGPLAAFAPGLPGTLVLSGPDWTHVQQAIEDLRVVAAQYPQFEGSLPPRADRARPVPVLEGAGTTLFSQFGIDSFSFNGRRYRSEFDFALPADFYANKYGQAQIRLSAAYSGEVLPGSQIDVFVNGQIASVTPIYRTDGALRDLPIKVPMASFRPGVNNVEIVAALRTEADEVCAPGTVTVGTDQRLLISNDSSFTLPEFGRVSQVPNLAAFSGTGFPYDGGERPALVLGADDAALPAALTLLVRMAGHTDKALPISSVGMASPPPQSDAIFVGAYSQLPPDANQRLGVLQPYASEEEVVAGEASDIEATLQRWRATGSTGTTSLVGRAQHWVADLLSLGPNSLGVLPPSDAAYAPRLTDAAVVLQKLQPEGGVWTMLTVPDHDRLANGVATVTNASLWPKWGGRVTVVPEGAENTQVIEPNQVSFYETAPWSFVNVRNVLANWLSSHVLAYALALGAALVGLTLATMALLRSFGRSTQ
jgi:hypothetical protein